MNGVQLSSYTGKESVGPFVRALAIPRLTAFKWTSQTVVNCSRDSLELDKLIDGKPSTVGSGIIDIASFT